MGMLLFFVSGCDNDHSSNKKSTGSKSSKSTSQINYESNVEIVNRKISDADADALYYAMSDYEAILVRGCENELAKTVKIESNADVHKVCVVAIAGRKN